MALYPPLPPPPGSEPVVEEEVEDEPQHRRWPLVATLGILVVASAIVGVTVWGRTDASDACETSTIGSARFGYCIAAPGWRFRDERPSARSDLDEMVRPAEASALRIVAVDLDPGQDLDVVVQTVRSIESEGGIELGDPVERDVAGVPAVQWDIALEDGGTEARHIREVVFVRSGNAWRVQLLADADVFEQRVDEFDAILRSWVFR